MLLPDTINFSEGTPQLEGVIQPSWYVLCVIAVRGRRANLCFREFAVIVGKHAHVALSLPS